MFSTNDHAATSPRVEPWVTAGKPGGKHQGTAQVMHRHTIVDLQLLRAKNSAYQTRRPRSSCRPSNETQLEKVRSLVAAHTAQSRMSSPGVFRMDDDTEEHRIAIHTPAIERG